MQKVKNFVERIAIGTRLSIKNVLYFLRFRICIALKTTQIPFKDCGFSGAVFAYEFCKEGEELENYTKYALKSWDELADLLENKDNLFVIACNKCFKAFETLEEPECDKFVSLASGLDKTVTGVVKQIFCATKTTQVRRCSCLRVRKM